jgi:hypothetical protein
MIVENPLEFKGRDFHNAIEESRNDDPAATVNPVWRDYSLGKFRPVARDAKMRIAQNGVDNDVPNVSENLISQCLDEIANRIRFERYGCENAAVQAWLEVFSLKNQMKGVIPGLVRRVQTDGNAALSVSWKRSIAGRDVGRPVVHQESWWDGESGIFVATDDTNETLWAVSEWVDYYKQERRTVYLPDRILRFYKDGSGWKLIEGGEVEWTRDGRPLGVPVAHFTNGPPSYGHYTGSTVASVIGSQDSLNATLFNRQAVVALTGSPIYWASGITTSETETTVEPGTMWVTPNAAARFGAIPPGAIDGLLNEAADLRETITGAFPVPAYRIGSGQWPSALALQRSDGPMISACQALVRTMTPGLVLIAHRAMELHNIHGDDDDLDESAERAKITLHFEPVDQVDPATKVEIDLSTVELYHQLSALPRTLMQKTGVLTKEEQEDLELELEGAVEQAAQAPLDSGVAWGSNGRQRGAVSAVRGRDS